MKKRLLIALLLVMMAPAVWGQGCAICTKTAAGLGEKSARGLNSGILYLAFLPLGIIGSLGFIWWKYNKDTQ